LEQRLPEASRTVPQTGQHPTDASPVLHLLTGDLENLCRLGWIRERSRVPLIREPGGELTRVRPPENEDQLTKRTHSHGVHDNLRQTRFFEKSFPDARHFGTLVHTYAYTDDR
jgi:hypothetical protein